MTTPERNEKDVGSLPWCCEQMVNGHAEAATREAWAQAVSQDPALAAQLTQQQRMHLLLAVALARPHPSTVAAHAIRLAAATKVSQRQHAVRATVRRSRHHRYRQRWRPIAALALVAILLAAANMLWPPSVPPSSAVTATPTAPASFWIEELAANTVLHTGSGRSIGTPAVAVGADLRGRGAWRLQSSDGQLELGLQGDSHVRVLDAKVVAIEGGRAQIAVKPGDDSGWSFPTPHADVGILGTRFVLTVEAGRTHLLVETGAVTFQPHGEAAVIVSAGGSAQAEDPRTVLWQAPQERDHVEGWTTGSLRALPGPLGRSAFHASMLPREGVGFMGVAFAAEDDGDLVVAPVSGRILADVWLPVSASGVMTVQGWDRRAGHNVQALLRDLPRGQWVAIDVPLADFRPVGPEPTAPGERPLRTVMFVVDGDDPTQFWVARARVFQP